MVHGWPIVRDAMPTLRHRWFNEMCWDVVSWYSHISEFDSGIKLLSNPLSLINILFGTNVGSMLEKRRRRWNRPHQD